MMYRQKYRGGVWVDLEQPSDEEIRSVAREFGISERLETELLSPTPFPLSASDHSHTLTILHFPAHGAGHSVPEEAGRNQEIDIVVGRDSVITVRYEVVAPLYRLRKLLESEELLSDSTVITTDMLIEILFLHLYAAVRDHTNHIADRLARIEHDMFTTREHSSIRAISEISRAYLHLDAALANHEEPLSRFLDGLCRPEFFGAPFLERKARILTERAQVAQLVFTHRAAATELRETNSALLESRQNEIMKALMIISVIVLPLELIAFIFAMHMPGTPLENDPNAFWIIMGAMLGAVAIVFLYFAKKRWIF